MLIKNMSRTEIELALSKTNIQFEDNIEFRRFDIANKKQTRFNVTLKCKDSKKPGHRRGFGKLINFQQGFDRSKAKRLSYACWHVHGVFFDNLIEIQSAAAIRSGSSLANPNRIDTGGWITKDGGNWQDRNIGSEMFPYYFSEACDCGEDDD